MAHRNIFRTFVRLISIFTLLVVTSPCLAFAQNELEKRVKEYTLDNGMKILVLKHPGSPSFAAYVRFLVGAVDENVGETGIAHILEHMLFKGSKTIGTTDFRKEERLMKEVEKYGVQIDSERRKGEKADKEKIATLKEKLEKTLAEQRKYIAQDEISSIYSKNGGNAFNAFTSMDTTTYMVKLPSNKFELWAWLESDRLREPVLREYYAERDVVLEERRRSIENSPDGTLYEQFVSAAFNAHPYGKPVIGWESDISFLPKNAVKSFLETYYSPGNMVVCIVGDIEPGYVYSTIKKYFGDIPRKDIPPRVPTVEPIQKGERRVEVEFDANPQVMIGFHKPAFPAREDYVFDVIDSVLSQGRTSRLYKSLVLEKKIAVSVSGFLAPGSRYGNLYSLHAVPRAPHTTRELEEAIYAELELLKEKPLSEHELQKVVNNMEADFIRKLMSNSGLSYYLSYYQVMFGDWRYMMSYVDEIKKITPEDVMRVAEKYLVKQNRVVATLVPAGGKK